ncbi:hypothetical protein IEZ26_16375 [Nocardioides cavernae]|uniref:Uncharacterized protein n=1 Tax=Nocardioides cavernae TaxID=1921566 RepID=A0ABR8NDI2_9ACTN|nr:hypothetical protein [Nocardioides cavernae]MBD3926202.1 hypothetical protein [Nocardioides cavernae]MBM7513794.1 hypothetical protein [Nocardioides cavernae]
MDTTRWSARALAAVTVGAVLALPGTAHAGHGSFDDPVGDSTAVDITRVRVVHANAVKVRVRSAVPLDAGQVYSFWIDTGRGPRPTFHVSFRANSDFGSGIAVVESFGQRPIRTVQCPGMRAHADMFDDQPVSVRIPRTCLGDPKRVRVAVKFEDEITGSADWAPERRTFGPWVGR